MIDENGLDPDCLFCKIIKHEIPADIILETNHSLAFRDINPQAPTHVLVIPKRHAASLEAMDDFVNVPGLVRIAKEVARQEGIAESGYRVVINTGENGGQTVSHLHLHVLGGRRMTWPPG